MMRFGRVGSVIGLGLSMAMGMTLGLAWAGHSAWAIEDLGQLRDSTDIGSVAIGEARRALKADMQDWSDDREERKIRRIWSCGLLGGGVLGEVAFRIWQAKRFAPDTALTLPASELAAKVPFTQAERERLARLEARETPDETDKLRLVIDRLAFVMKVSGRLYKEEIDEASRLTGSRSCAVQRLSIGQDKALLSAGYRMLFLYDLLEAMLKNS